VAACTPHSLSVCEDCRLVLLVVHLPPAAGPRSPYALKAAEGILLSICLWCGLLCLSLSVWCGGRDDCVVGRVVAQWWGRVWVYAYLVGLCGLETWSAEERSECWCGPADTVYAAGRQGGGLIKPAAAHWLQQVTTRTKTSSVQLWG
jgi:hypothetical protein